MRSQLSISILTALAIAAGCKSSSVDGPGCGNGIVEPELQETCDGDCPTSCTPPDPCTAAELVGSPDLCNVRCVLTAITSCIDDDGCCPSSCTAASDSDCSGSCDDGVLNQGEGGVDCGGPCPPCPSCSDGVQNQGESGMDCGGPCRPCQPADTLPHDGPAADFEHGDLRLSADGHYLVHADGTPFVWIGDTSWTLFERTTREEADRYLEDRRAKGYTVLQTVAFALFEWNVANQYGHVPFLDGDPTSPRVVDGPDNDYWDHVDYVLDAARDKGIYIAILPTWANCDYFHSVWDASNAATYGQWLADRYRAAPNIIWILGGDRNPDGSLEVWDAMAGGLEAGDGGKHLVTYHPQGGGHSSSALQRRDWLDFHMQQTGHCPWMYCGSSSESYIFNCSDFGMEADYMLTPPRPVVDGEPRYEHHPICWNWGNGGFDDVDVRQAAYYAVFAGAFGHTYGCNDVWQFYDPRRPPEFDATMYWYDAIDLDGALDMLNLRRLLLSRPFASRIPDQSLLSAGDRFGEERVRATRSLSRAYAMVYTPVGAPFSVDLSAVGSSSGTPLEAWWFDPRSGDATRIDEALTNSGSKQFTAPGEPGRGNDWVLVIDDASQGFPPPGAIDPVNPRLAISEPHTGLIAPGSTLTIRARVAAASGRRVARVELHESGSLIETDDTEPYEFSLADMREGSYTFELRAVDSHGARGSESLEVRVSTQAASIGLIAGGYDDMSGVVKEDDWIVYCDVDDWIQYRGIDLGAGYRSFEARLCREGDADGHVEIRLDSLDGTLLGSYRPLDTGNWDPPPKTQRVELGSLGSGTHDVFLVFQGSYGLGNFERFAFVDPVPPSGMPTVEITAPLDGQVFTPGEAVDIEASASDSDGTIARVEFYRDGTLLGTDTSSPYTHRIDSIPAGACTLEARAFDDQSKQASDSIRIYASSGPPSFEFEAESYSAMEGITTGSYVGECDGGDWLRYDQIDLYDGYRQFDLWLGRPGDMDDGWIELRLDSLDGSLLGSYCPRGTGDWENIQKQSCALSATGSGVHDVFILFVGPGVYGFGNFDKFGFSNP